MQQYSNGPNPPKKKNAPSQPKQPLRKDRTVSSERSKEITDEFDVQINKIEQNQIVDVTESVFVSRLLPLALSRYVNIGEELHLGHWKAITGKKPTYGVRVRRPDGTSFVTPPLVLSPEVTFQGDSLLARLNEADAASSAGKPPVEVMDADALRPSFKTRGIGPALNAWLLIFKLYKIKLVPLTDEEKETGIINVDTPTPDVETNDQVIYDDEEGEVI